MNKDEDYMSFIAMQSSLGTMLLRGRRCVASTLLVIIPFGC